jgi:hypothetical protein
MSECARNGGEVPIHWTSPLILQAHMHWNSSGMNILADVSAVKNVRVVVAASFMLDGGFLW